MFNHRVVNCAPDHFEFWLPPAGAVVLVGAERQPFVLPVIPLPIHRGSLADGSPSDAAIGQGVYDYLRQFPDCEQNAAYAELLRDAYPHFISDLAAHAVMLDAKQVEPAYVLRKLTYLKILRLLEPANYGLLIQLSRGYFGLALEFGELARCRQHLCEAMRFGQELLALAPDDPHALALLAEVDQLLGDLPAAAAKWQRLAVQVNDPALLARIEARRLECARAATDETALVDDLESIAKAMQLHAHGEDSEAVALLEWVEEQGRLLTTLPSADFYWLLGVCRQGCGDRAGTAVALHKALAIEPDHAATLAALDAL